MIGYGMNKSKYDEMFAKYNAGEISVEAWLKFCNEFMDKILEQNKDVFMRLKYLEDKNEELCRQNRKYDAPINNS